MAKNSTVKAVDDVSFNVYPGETLGVGEPEGKIDFVTCHYWFS